MIASASNSRGYKDSTNGCLLARMELFHDERAGKCMNPITWARLYIIDPSIKPWKVGEKISNVNP
jgi:hypothetical protein